ncbi:MAG TPA: hypothetical protein VKV20_18665 [Ktedonobacteraceae bacterium]|jgi:hypothetical protein|nr:hypothetical protein [Ktedonobacteraceae bacterium]
MAASVVTLSCHVLSPKYSPRRYKEERSVNGYTNHGRDQTWLWHTSGSRHMRQRVMS